MCVYFSPFNTLHSSTLGGEGVAVAVFVVKWGTTLSTHVSRSNRLKVFLWHLIKTKSHSPHIHSRPSLALVFKSDTHLQTIRSNPRQVKRPALAGCGFGRCLHAKKSAGSSSAPQMMFTKVGPTSNATNTHPATIDGLVNVRPSEIFPFPYPARR